MSSDPIDLIVENLLSRYGLDSIDNAPVCAFVSKEGYDAEFSLPDIEKLWVAMTDDKIVIQNDTNWDEICERLHEEYDYESASFVVGDRIDVVYDFDNLYPWKYTQILSTHQMRKLVQGDMFKGLDLPPEMVVKLMEYMSPDSRRKFAMTSRRHNIIAKDDVNMRLIDGDTHITSVDDIDEELIETIAEDPTLWSGKTLMLASEQMAMRIASAIEDLDELDYIKFALLMISGHQLDDIFHKEFGRWPDMKKYGFGKGFSIRKSRRHHLFNQMIADCYYYRIPGWFMEYAKKVLDIDYDGPYPMDHLYPITIFLQLHDALHTDWTEFADCIRDSIDNDEEYQEVYEMEFVVEDIGTCPIHQALFG